MFPETVENLVELRYLSLCDIIRIRTFPSWLGKLFKLEILNLSDTLVGKLPSTIGQLAELRSLNLQGTNIKTLPNEIGGLCKLPSR